MALNRKELRILGAAFQLIREAPGPLDDVLGAQSTALKVIPPVTVDRLLGEVKEEKYYEEAANWLRRCFINWDFVEDAEWTGATVRNSRDRRALIYKLLGLTDGQAKVCDEYFKVAYDLPTSTFITGKPQTDWEPWYSPERRLKNHYYWEMYETYLRTEKDWREEDLVRLDEASSQIVERLADPESPSPYQSRGLVVGYVQSGKTANFTGVIAKATDAGYRMIIVLSGLMNILREQTQRRIDKELLGQEQVDDDYSADTDWDQFLKHGTLPSQKGFFDFERFTGARDDFRRLNRGISALELRMRDHTKPYHHPVNLHNDKARIMVVKKNPAVLRKLIKDLLKVDKKTRVGLIPALVIDDESDQASINTILPKNRKPDKERTATNKAIVDLLKILERAQYVGYTATPFANVFIDPDDAEDLFPRDFVLSLPRPVKYMGVSDFYDSEQPKPEGFKSNKNAFIHPVQGDHEKYDNLPKAIDSFVLSGAIKIFRERAARKKMFQHHTMLVHISPRVMVQAEHAALVSDLFEQSNYAGGGPGIQRLEALWEGNFQPVSRLRAEGLPVPKQFSDLEEDIGECVRRINEGPKPVLVVNGDNKDDAPNFEKEGVWKIVVGGAKLSRGYTIEGLTVSYYRRHANAADTLMQMGRWFGYREGYRDLVRVFIGTNEPMGRNKTINLYEAFGAICKDEEDFREELKRYASLVPGERITPKQVPPLVSAHMLPPASPNKMYNARIQFKNFGGETAEHTAAPAKTSDIRFNERLMKNLLSGSRKETAVLSADLMKKGVKRGVEFDAVITDLSTQAVMEFLKGYRWHEDFEKCLRVVLEYLDGKEFDPEIDNWLLVSPLQKTRPTYGEWKADKTTFHIRERSRVGDGLRYAVITEPDHRGLAALLTGSGEGELTGATTDLRRDRQAVMLFYPIKSQSEFDKGFPPTMGFGLLFPKNSKEKRILFTVADPSRPDAVTVSR